MQTAIGAKLAEKGISARNVRFQIALAEFQNNGGNYSEALAMLDAAYGNGGGGQKAHIEADHPKIADTPRQEATGRGLVADKARVDVPAASSRRNGAGQPNVVKAKNALPRPVSSSYITAAKDGAKVIALTVLDSYKVRDGRSIGDVTFRELERLRMDNTREAAVIRLILRHAPTSGGDTKVRDAVNTEVMERIIQRAAELADAL